MKLKAALLYPQTVFHRTKIQLKSAHFVLMMKLF